MKAKILLLSAVIALSACSEEHGDLQQWMNETKVDAKKKIRPVEAPPPVEPVTYFAPEVSGPDAFDPLRKKAAYQSAGSPDMNRPKELLENYSLDNLKYIGSIGLAGSKDITALIEADGHIYRVKVGNRMGQNFGKITHISPEAITLLEVVENISGEWETRPNTLSSYTDSESTQ